jgi:hypothetical protein
MMTPVSYDPSPQSRPAPAQVRALRDIQADWLRWNPAERLMALALIVMPPVASLLFIALAGG